MTGRVSSRAQRGTLPSIDAARPRNSPKKPHALRNGPKGPRRFGRSKFRSLAANSSAGATVLFQRQTGCPILGHRRHAASSGGGYLRPWQVAKRNPSASKVGEDEQSPVAGPAPLDRRDLDSTLPVSGRASAGPPGRPVSRRKCAQPVPMWPACGPEASA